MQLKEHLKKHHKLIIVNEAPLATGFGIEGRKVLLDDGRTAAIKFNFSIGSDEFLNEANMIETLFKAAWPVPKVWAADEHCLCLEWLNNDGTSLSPKAEFQTGEMLAKLHSNKLSHFGYEKSTPIGRLTQPNKMSKNWVDFFRDQRLLHMATIAKQQGKLPLGLYQRLLNLADNLHNHIEEPPHPSLIHGDLWGGNVIVNQGKLAGLIDPAIYHAHPEIELAFTQMFTTFGQDFFKGYQSITPQDPNFFKERIALYNLYPTLVHVILFGSSYLSVIDQSLNRLGY